MLNVFRRKQAGDNIVSLYGAIVAQARKPVFYSGLGVPDSLNGRFDMIVLHLALVMRRLRAGAPPAEQAAVQQLFDHFCRDMEHNLREMGVSDLAVPRRMRAFGEAFYGRAAAYDRALESGDADALTAALCRNVFARERTERDGPERLCAYVQRCEALLAQQPPAALAQGRVLFPDLPATDAPGAAPAAAEQGDPG